ncbi:MAG TPA: hypothetical protein VFL19_01070 [Nitrospira sp.]|nr:hypothetical protein [Nitrospira sp.]
MNTADVVVIGDSQTWGINVTQKETWPSALMQVGHVSVYSMSLGGWGPIQYEILAKDALILNPRAILVGLYLGNDIFDSCSHVYGTDAYPQYRRADGNFTEALSALHARLKLMDDHTRIDRAHQRLAEMGAVAKVWQKLAGRSVILQTLMARGWVPAVPSVDELYEAADVSWAQASPEAASWYRGRGVSTVMTYGYRGAAVDLSNLCIRDGVRITREVLASLKDLSEKRDIRMGVVFIPTKEWVYAAADKDLRSHVTGEFANLFKNETSIKKELQEACVKIELVCVDAADILVPAAQKGAMLYKADSDGHPIAQGYRQIAYAGLQALETLGVLHAQQARRGVENTSR